MAKRWRPDVAALWREAMSQLKTWQRRGERAVHKPLLSLLLIARAERGDSGRVVFSEIDEPLRNLLLEFGPPRRSHHPEYPFWHLQSDRIWEIEQAHQLPFRTGGRSVPRSILIRENVAGRVPRHLWEELVANDRLRAELVRGLLSDFWPETLHEGIRQTIGLPLEASTHAPRDPGFRAAVLRAYERRCAVCGYDGRLGTQDLALEAAHIRWHCYDGPDELDNGLALCSFHHRALDGGAIGITEDRRVQVSADFVGGEMVDSLARRFIDVSLRTPQAGMRPPAIRHIRWHTKQVFRSPARRAAC